MNNKLKKTRVVQFKEDYFSKPGLATGADPIYTKGSTHAIHEDLVKKLEKAGAKMSVSIFDEQKAIRKSKEQMVKNKKALAGV